MPVKDEIGNRYGSITVVSRAENDTSKNVYWNAVCDCGRVSRVRGTALRWGYLPRCECQLLDLKDSLYGRLTVLGEGPKVEYRRSWHCKCICGKELIVEQSKLRTGHTKSCGCLAADKMSENMSTHRLSSNRYYKIWVGMLSRCNNPEHKAYKYYGGKGVKVCSEWSESPEKFLNWLESHGYKHGLNVDRIDGDGDYSPENCRVVTPEINANNTKIRSDNTSGYTGIWYDESRGKYQVRVSSIRLSSEHIGRFDTLKEAVEARNKYIIDNNLPHRIQTYVETSD